VEASRCLNIKVVYCYMIKHRSDVIHISIVSMV
jgi:hypothetical protein